MPDSHVGDDLETANAPEGEGTWSFDESVAASFEDMLERSIPNYQQMREFTTGAAVWSCERFGARGYAPLVVDLGASRGSALAPIIEKLDAHARYMAAEISDPMLAILEERFRGPIGRKLMTVKPWDLRAGFPPIEGKATVVMSILTLQFVPIEYRQRLLREAAEALRPGGILILVEKVMASGAELESLMNDVYWQEKERQGYTRDAIDRKRLSLEGVLVPLTAKFNEELVLQNGFATIDVGWAWGPFRGYVAVKR